MPHAMISAAIALSRSLLNSTIEQPCPPGVSAAAATFPAPALRMTASRNSSFFSKLTNVLPLD